MQLSALNADDIVRFWAELDAFRSSQRASGAFDERRRAQMRAWFDERLQSEVLHAFQARADVREAMPATWAALAQNRLTVPAAVTALLQRAGLVASKQGARDDRDEAR